MDCPKCHQPVEAGAAFCGNCGQALRPPSRHLAVAGVPSYAIATPYMHVEETRALLSVIFGVMGVVVALLIAAGGLAFGILGLIMGTMSRRAPRKSLSTTGIILSTLALVTGLAVWTYSVHQQDLQNKQQVARSQEGHLPAVAANNLTTPCYYLAFNVQLNIRNAANSCDMIAFNGQTLESSTDAYKIYANKATGVTSDNFTTLAKTAIEKDIQTSAPNFDVDAEGAASFSGSPSYVVTAVDKVHGVTITEAAVIHKSGTGDNMFVLVHITTLTKTDLSVLEHQWQWK